MFKGINNDLIKYVIANSIIQCSGRMKEIKANSGAKNMNKVFENLGITVEYASIRVNGSTEVHVLVKQGADTALIYKKIRFMPSSEKCKGLAEPQYDENAVSKSIMGVYIVGFGVVEAGMLATEAIGSATLKGIGTAAAGAGKAAVSAVKTSADIKATTRVAAKVENAVAENVAKTLSAADSALGTSTLESASKLATAMDNKALVKASDVITQKAAAKAGMQEARALTKEAAGALKNNIGSTTKGAIQGTGAIVNDIASAAVTKGANIIGKEGAKQTAEKITQKLATDSAQFASGGAVYALLLAMTAYCVIKYLEYVPYIYHYIDDDGIPKGYGLMKVNKDTKGLGVSKDCNSVLVDCADMFDDKQQPIIALYPVAKQKERHSLYGLFHTTYTSWPKSEDRHKKLKEKHMQLLETV